MSKLNTLNENKEQKSFRTLTNMLEDYTFGIKYNAEERNPASVQFNRANDKMMRAAKLLLEAKQELEYKYLDSI